MDPVTEQNRPRHSLPDSEDGNASYDDEFAFAEPAAGPGAPTAPGRPPQEPPGQQARLVLPEPQGQRVPPGQRLPTRRGSRARRCAASP